MKLSNELNCEFKEIRFIKLKFPTTSDYVVQRKIRRKKGSWSSGLFLNSIRINYITEESFSSHLFHRYFL
jgi:hypothetical protein